VTLEQVIADVRGQAAVLRHNGFTQMATGYERIAEQVAGAAVDYLTWHSEAEAQLRTGWSARRLRSYFTAWEAQGMAEKRGRLRYYRQVMLPRRANLEAARADAERMARAS
jgi:hypothetical protein